MSMRTDLALEARELFLKNADIKDKILSSKNKKDNIIIQSVEILDERTSQVIKKPVGKYITLESEDFKLSDPALIKKASYVLKEQLLNILKTISYKTILIVGLGNRNITSDALGPQVISKVMVTRHLKEYMPEHIDDDIMPVSAISPGVLGITGIETNDIISAVCKKVNPDLVFVIDALASSSPKRIATTIQITDTGINPGSGVGNNRKEISKNSLGIPVIAIGVPTVVDLVSVVSPSDKNNFEKDFFVTPKEIDRLIENLSKIIANGINLSLHNNIDLEYIEAFIG
ncbi:MAG: GPR endopeptidase [Ruminococcaceae bacterium]|nr:GPR endopeptidase [Oscillospiraceae bacterium]